MKTSLLNKTDQAMEKKTGRIPGQVWMLYVLRKNRVKQHIISIISAALGKVKKWYLVRKIRKYKVKLYLCLIKNLAMKACGGMSWRHSVSSSLSNFTPPPTKEHPIPTLDRKLCRPQGQSGCCGERNLLPLPEIKPWFPGHSAHSYEEEIQKQNPSNVIKFLTSNIHTFIAQHERKYTTR